MRDFGFLVKGWPTILSCDLAGEVIEFSEGVTDVKKDQRVLAHPVALMTGKVENAAFQNYTVVFATGTCLIPENMKFEEVAVLPLSISTVAASLFQDELLNLPLPKINLKKSGKTLLVGGGSGSIGSQAVQLATASGIDVVATLSKRNFEYYKKLEANEVFDYNNPSPSPIGDLAGTLQDTRVIGACGDEKSRIYIEMPKIPFLICDTAIEGRDSTIQTAQALAQLGSDTTALVQEPPADLPTTFKAKQIFAALIPVAKQHTAKDIYQDILPAALKGGQHTPAPPPNLIAHGVEQWQERIEKMKKGASATKLVFTL